MIVSADNRTIQPGYAGPSRHVDTARLTDCRAFCHRRRVPPEERTADYSDCVSIHAEQNALILADMVRMAGGTMVVTRAPCFTCFKMVSNSTLTRLVYWNETKEIVRTTLG